MTFRSSAVIGELVARAFAGMLDMCLSPRPENQRRDHGAWGSLSNRPLTIP
jgi:hypothetical protein